MLFRPEEIHAASIEGGRTGPSPRERARHVPDRRGRSDLEDYLVFHPKPDWFTAIEAPRIDLHFLSGEEPAHG